MPKLLKSKIVTTFRFNNNKAVIKVSCAQWNQPNPTDTEISDIHAGILAAATASGVDKRFILAIIMQESKGCVRVPTTNGGVVNPGLVSSLSLLFLGIGGWSRRKEGACTWNV